MKPITLSLIIPTYNRCNLITETIDSALNQIQPFDEIIVVDDGSTDGTALSIISKYGDCINVIRIENSGVQHARNVGVNASKCEYITLCDSDDIFDKSYSKTIKARLANFEFEKLIFTNFNIYFENKIQGDKFAMAPVDFFEGCTEQFGFITDIPDLYARTLIFQPLFPSGMTIEKALYLEVGGYNSAFRIVGSEDWEFTLRVLSKSDATLCRIPLVNIRKHSGNQSGNRFYQALGEAYILEYAISNHDKAKMYKGLMHAEINKRRIDAFDIAYSHADFSNAEKTLTLIGIYPNSIKFHIKRAILRLPKKMKNIFWSFSQWL